MSKVNLPSERLKDQISELVKENKNLEKEREKIIDALKYQYQHLQDYSIPGEEVEEQKEIIDENRIENQDKLNRIEENIKRNSEMIEKLMKRYSEFRRLEGDYGSNKNQDEKDIDRW